MSRYSNKMAEACRPSQSRQPLAEEICQSTRTLEEYLLKLQLQKRELETYRELRGSMRDREKREPVQPDPGERLIEMGSSSRKDYTLTHKLSDAIFRIESQIRLFGEHPEEDFERPTVTKRSMPQFAVEQRSTVVEKHSLTLNRETEGVPKTEKPPAPVLKNVQKPLHPGSKPKLPERIDLLNRAPRTRNLNLYEYSQLKVVQPLSADESIFAALPVKSVRSEKHKKPGDLNGDLVEPHSISEPQELNVIQPEDCFSTFEFFVIMPREFLEQNNEVIETPPVESVEDVLTSAYHYDMYESKLCEPRSDQSYRESDPNQKTMLDKAVSTEPSGRMYLQTDKQLQHRKTRALKSPKKRIAKQVSTHPSTVDRFMRNLKQEVLIKERKVQERLKSTRVVLKELRTKPTFQEPHGSRDEIKHIPSSVDRLRPSRTGFLPTIEEEKSSQDSSPNRFLTPINSPPAESINKRHAKPAKASVAKKKKKRLKFKNKKLYPIVDSDDEGSGLAPLRHIDHAEENHIEIIENCSPLQESIDQPAGASDQADLGSDSDRRPISRDSLEVT